MEIRGIREPELQEMIDLICLVFRPDGQERFWSYIRGDASYRLDQTRVVLVDGRIVATLRVWDRRMRIGSSVVRMGGIGGVATHPDFRATGYASALMRDTAEYLKSSGYHLGLLFSAISCEFYRKLGWGCVPCEGFRVTRGKSFEPRETEWTVEPFQEGRDLESVVTLYEAYNARQTGSIVRSPEHWNSAPARIRQILPTVVARRGDTLGGYLNYRTEGNVATVLEVAVGSENAVAALSDHLLGECEQHGIEEVSGDLPHRHPLVDSLVAASAGDLSLTGNASMMLYPANLSALLEQLLPCLESRLNASNQSLKPFSICFELGDQRCVLSLQESGILCLADDDPAAAPIPLPGTLFWRALLGESSWSRIEPTLRARGISVAPEISGLLEILFPAQEVILWAPDHF